MEQGRYLSFVQIEREQFSLSNSHVKGKTSIEKFLDPKFDLNPGPKNPAILMSLVSVYFPHISISNAEKRRFIAASVLEIFKKYSRSSYFAVDSSFGLFFKLAHILELYI